jgi:hypothetical protein
MDTVTEAVPRKPGDVGAVVVAVEAVKTLTRCEARYLRF